LRFNGGSSIFFFFSPADEAELLELEEPLRERRCFDRGERLRESELDEDDEDELEDDEELDEDRPRDFLIGFPFAFKSGEELKEKKHILKKTELDTH